MIGCPTVQLNAPILKRTIWTMLIQNIENAAECYTTNSLFLHLSHSGEER
jgi:hypothetical protein